MDRRAFIGSVFGAAVSAAVPVPLLASIDPVLPSFDFVAWRWHSSSSWKPMVGTGRCVYELIDWV